MANSKISGLTAATTPLAGTEELALLQTSDKRITVANFAAGAVKSNATTGVLQVVGPVAASTRIMATPDANFTVARTDAGQTFTGDQTILANIVQGTAAKGVNFTANTPAAGMTSQLLNWYEAGTWTPNQGGGLTVVGAFSSVGTYTRVGRLVTVTGTLTAATSITFVAGGVITSNLPFTGATNGVGAAVRGDIAQSVAILTSSASIYGVGAMSVTPNVFFSVNYSI
jgi:hypothetical protein